MASTRTIVITGANRGLGLALTEEYLSRGWNVVASYHNKPSAELQVLAQNLRLTLASLELGDPASVAAFARFLHSECQSIDVLLNNAAILGDITTKAGEGLDFADVERVIGVNALGPLRLVDACLDLVMASSLKTVVNISSEAGSVSAAGRDGWYAYCMSKAALNMESVLLHNHIRPLGGRVLVLHPGWVRSWMQGHLDTNAELEPQESASCLAARIDEYTNLTAAPDRPPYLDWKGRAMQW